VIGFTAEVSSRELVELGRERGIAVMEDLGSGSLVDLRPWGFPYEPTVPEVVASGDLVSFSGDKLLGGPQAGIVVGTRAIVSRLRRNPWTAPSASTSSRSQRWRRRSPRTRPARPRGGATLRLLTEPLVTVVARARRVLRGLGAEAAQRLAARVDEGRAGGRRRAADGGGCPRPASRSAPRTPPPAPSTPRCASAIRRWSAGSSRTACSSTAGRCCRRRWRGS